MVQMRLSEGARSRQESRGDGRIEAAERVMSDAWPGGREPAR